MSKNKSKSSVTLIEGDIMMGTEKANNEPQEEEDYTSINLMQASMNEIATFPAGQEVYKVGGSAEPTARPQETETAKLTKEIASLREVIEGFKVIAEKLIRRGR
jgi:hypothetical protein